MKKLFLISVFVLLSSCNYVSAQERQCNDLDECNQKLAQAAQMVNKLLEVKKADDKAVVDLQIQIASLQTTIAELKAQKTTPCSISQEKFKLDASYFLDRYNQAQSKDEKRQVEKILNRQIKLSSKAVKSQCGIKDNNLLIDILKAAGGLSTLFILLK